MKLNNEITAEQIERFWSKVDKTPGLGPNGDCWHWTAGMKTDGEYGGFWINQINNTISTHKFSFLVAHNFNLEDVPRQIFICHKCNNPRCVNPAHLKLGLPKDNGQDMILAGNSQRADKNTKAKLDWEAVRAIRKLWSTGKYTCRQLADMFLINDSSIYNVVVNKHWHDPKYEVPDLSNSQNGRRCKFSDEIVQLIITDRKNNFEVRHICTKYNISQSQYYNIINRRQRKEVQI